MPGASVVVHAPSLVRVAASRVISRMRRNRGNQPNDQERFRNQNMQANGDAYRMHNKSGPLGGIPYFSTRIIFRWSRIRLRLTDTKGGEPLTQSSAHLRSVKKRGPTLRRSGLKRAGLSQGCRAIVRVECRCHRR
jgi:hypothetical protein